MAERSTPQGLGELALAPHHLHDARLSRSLLLGLWLLSVLPADGSYTSLTEIAQAVGMTRSSAHRYVTTLLTVGLVEREPSTRKYRLAHVG